MRGRKSQYVTPAVTPCRYTGRRSLSDAAKKRGTLIVSTSAPLSMQCHHFQLDDFDCFEGSRTPRVRHGAALKQVDRTTVCIDGAQVTHARRRRTHTHAHLKVSLKATHSLCLPSCRPVWAVSTAGARYRCHSIGSPSINRSSGASCCTPLLEASCPVKSRSECAIFDERVSVQQRPTRGKRHKAHWGGW